MMPPRPARPLGLVCLSVVAVWIGAACARAGDTADPSALAARVDLLLERQMAANGVHAAPPIDDAGYLRRVSLDLVGRIPTAHDVYAFLDDPAPDKRQKLVARLLDSPGRATHQVNQWRALLIPETMTNVEMRLLQPGFDTWLRQKVRGNTPYDRFVYELVATPIGGKNPQATMNPGGTQANPLAFYAAKESKPENLAAAVSRVFLGVQIECAQCHNHPFAKWSREQFWGMAAFFGGIQQRGDGGTLQPMREIIDRRELAIPNTDRVVPATFLDDLEPEWKFQTSARVTLAEWMVRPDNPWFARNAVNRLWAQLFGHGIVEPVDDFNDKNAPSHPELLDELARAFVAAKFDVPYMVRALTATKAYQRSSVLTESGQRDPRLFARMAVKGLTEDQLFDSLVVATGYRGPDAARTAADGNPGGGVRAMFAERFALPGRKTDPQTSILQALSLMNGSFTAEATGVGRGETLAAIASLPDLSSADRVEALYVATLSRRPRPDELQRMTRHVEAGGESHGKERLADVLWVLLNSVEFRLNH